MNDKAVWQEAGFFTEVVNVATAMDKLADHVQQMGARFANFSREELLHQTAPGKWSRLQIIGHLIDSAVNNLRRFTEIQFLPQPYKLVSYQQNEWVMANGYQNLPPDHLLNLWMALNQQIIYVVKNIPAEKLEYRVDPQYENKEIKSLGWIICDYVAHLEHHLKQLDKFKS